MSENVWEHLAEPAGLGSGDQRLSEFAAFKRKQAIEQALEPVVTSAFGPRWRATVDIRKVPRVHYVIQRKSLTFPDPQPWMVHEYLDALSAGAPKTFDTWRAAASYVRCALSQGSQALRERMGLPT